jgi:hypothetical protein
MTPRPVRVITVYEFSDGTFDMRAGGVGERRGEPSREQVNTTKTKVAVAVLKELDECDLPALEREMSSDEG